MGEVRYLFFVWCIGLEVAVQMTLCGCIAVSFIEWLVVAMMSGVVVRSLPEWTQLIDAHRYCHLDAQMNKPMYLQMRRDMNVYARQSGKTQIKVCSFKESRRYDFQ